MSDNTFYKIIFSGVIFGITYFTIDGLLKLAREKNYLAKDRSDLITQLADNRRELSQCQEKLWQCEKAILKK